MSIDFYSILWYTGLLLLQVKHLPIAPVFSSVVFEYYMTILWKGQPTNSDVRIIE